MYFLIKAYCLTFYRLNSTLPRILFQIDSSEDGRTTFHERQQDVELKELRDIATLQAEIERSAKIIEEMRKGGTAKKNTPTTCEAGLSPFERRDYRM